MKLVTIHYVVPSVSCAFGVFAGLLAIGVQHSASSWVVSILGYVVQNILIFLLTCLPTRCKATQVLHSEQVWLKEATADFLTACGLWYNIVDCYYMQVMQPRRPEQSTFVVYASGESLIGEYLIFVSSPAIVAPLGYLLSERGRPRVSSLASGLIPPMPCSARSAIICTITEQLCLLFI